MAESIEPANCPNCGATGTAKYCAQCGQRQGPRLMSLRRILLDALDDQLSINSALPRTLGHLLGKPGSLTTEYLNGRIARYIPPFRLYLAASIVFFLALSIASSFGRDSGSALTFRTSDGTVIPTDSMTMPLSEAGRPILVVTAQDEFALSRGYRFFGISIDTAQDTTFVYVNMLHARLTEAVAQRIRGLVGLPPSEIAQTIVPPMIERAPAAMFLLLPVFAGLLKLLYIRSGRFYVEHFVFGLHTHAFTFFVFTVMVLLPQSRIEAFLLLWVTVYYFLAMKTVYRQGIPLTLLKGFVLSIIYSFIVGIAVLGVLAVTVLLG